MELNNQLSGPVLENLKEINPPSRLEFILKNVNGCKTIMITNTLSEDEYIRLTDSMNGYVILEEDSGIPSNDRLPIIIGNNNLAITMARMGLKNQIIYIKYMQDPESVKKFNRNLLGNFKEDPLIKNKVKQNHCKITLLNTNPEYNVENKSPFYSVVNINDY